MITQHRYLIEKAEGGCNTDSIAGFPRICLPYLGEKFFPAKDAVIIDIGAGWGHSCLPLKWSGYSNLIAVDSDPSAKKTFEQEGINFYHLNIEKEGLPFQDSTADVILSFLLIEHLHDSANFFKEASRVLKKGGFLIITTHDWRKQYKIFWRDHTHIHPYDKESIGKLLHCFEFEIVWLKSFGYFRGIGRSGLWKIWKPLMFTGMDLIAVGKKL